MIVAVVPDTHNSAARVHAQDITWVAVDEDVERRERAIGRDNKAVRPRDDWTVGRELGGGDRPCGPSADQRARVVDSGNAAVQGARRRGWINRQHLSVAGAHEAVQ